MEQNSHAFDDFSNIDYDNLLDYFASLSGEEYLIITGLLALIIARSVGTTSRQNSLGNFFIQLGQSIITITGQDITRHPSSPSAESFEDLKREIEQIKRRLDNL